MLRPWSDSEKRGAYQIDLEESMLFAKTTGARGEATDSKTRTLNYSELFRPTCGGEVVPKHIHSEPVEQGPNLVEAARVIHKRQSEPADRG